jgi:ATP-binding cassette subfamily C (CFTR/MRP) protein 4
LAYIPQQPFLIQGSIRENLDPFKNYSDEEIEKVLKEVALWDHIIKNCENGIYTLVSESNSVFSLGQKQLLCLARAIIRKTKMLVLDEATANVDLETDNFIQETLKKSFVNCTVLVIAHRLATVIDSDRILVMDKGRGVEFDHPFKLLAQNDTDEEINNETFFTKMVKATGEETAK